MKKRNIKNYLLLFLMLFTAKNVAAESLISYQTCNYTKEYTNWLKLSSSEKEKTLMPTVCQNNNSKDKFYFVGSNAKMPNVSVTDSKFNLKDYNLVTPIKDQKNTLACWAFASNAAIESNLLSKNLGVYDLSEAHLELATQSTYNSYRNTFNRVSSTGGNYSVSAAYLMNNWGPIKEESLPFDDLIKSYDSQIQISANQILQAKPIIDVNSIAFLGNNEGACDADITKDIKEYLITNGALATYLHLEDGSKTAQYLYYNEEEIVNHAATIVGWDDKVSKDSFSGTKPTKDGAWIIKNSYGGDSYQYVSYEDVDVCNNVVGFFDAETEVEDNAYYYDNLGVNSTFKTTNNTVYFASVFNKKTLNHSELLKEVAMYFAKINQKYEIYFANGDVKDITKAKKIAEGTSSFVGYKTIKLPTTEKITSDKYSIIIKVTDSNGVEYGVSSKINENTNYSTLKLIEGVQYVSLNGSEFTDVTKAESPYQLSIRTYTNVGEEITKNSTSNNSYTAKTEGNANNGNVASDVDTPAESVKTGYYMPATILGGSVVVIGIILKKNKAKKLYKI